jgi:hypothetical protein
LLPSPSITDIILNGGETKSVQANSKVDAGNMLCAILDIGWFPPLLLLSATLLADFIKSQ